MVPRLRPAKLWPPLFADVPWMWREWGNELLAIRKHQRNAVDGILRKRLAFPNLSRAVVVAKKQMPAQALWTVASRRAR